MIEYHSVCIGPVMPPKPLSSTYRDKLIARFGRVPSMVELARMEQGRAFKQKPYVPHAKDPTPGDLARRAALLEIGKVTRESIMRILTEPMTAPEIGEALKRTRQLVNRHLVVLQAEGKVTRRKENGVNVWSPVK